MECANWYLLCSIPVFTLDADAKLYIAMSGLKERVNLVSLLLWISLSVRLIHWKNRRWSQLTQFFLSLPWTILWKKYHVMFQMMVLQCWHLNPLWRQLTLQESGYHFAKSLRLNHAHLSFTSLRRLTIWRTKFNLLLWRNVEQWK